MDVPQLNLETGISGDYWNEWGALPFRLEVKKPVGEAKLQMIADYLKKSPIRAYENVYKNCENVITEKNSEKVRRLSELADKVNSFTDPRRFTESEFEAVINEVQGIIYPDRKKPYYPRE